MLKIVYPICCGVDVHKRFIIAKRAIVAIARMMLTCVYHMLLKDEGFNPCD